MNSESVMYLLARRLGEERLQDVAHVDAAVANRRLDGLGHLVVKRGTTQKLKKIKSINKINLITTEKEAK